ncbi:DnaD domain protein [Staphylococcus hominis]|uniref:DnaD domain-containing protein n=1 Tax=Staphylococcus hominis TaxID=1290 RepID=UPI0031BADA7B
MSRRVKITCQDVLKSHANDTEYTTTTENSRSGNYHNNIINKIRVELGINITPAYKNEMLKLSSCFDDKIINYAIEYTSINGSRPKQFLLKVLSNWKNANITTLEQAKNFKISNKKTVLFNFLRRKHLNG